MSKRKEKHLYNRKCNNITNNSKKRNSRKKQLAQLKVTSTLNEVWLIFVRSSRSEVFSKKGVLRSFTKFTGKDSVPENFPVKY